MPPIPRRSPHHRPDVRSERGLTLTELAIVGMLATMVMLALTGFYFNSQKMWLDGSTKALVQRDATLLVDELGRSIHQAGSAVVTTSDPIHNQLALFDTHSTPLGGFAWNAGDSRIHRMSPSGDDLGPVVDSPTLLFQLSTFGNSLVRLDALELVSADGDTVRMASKFALLGQGS